jgi:uncharacterized RmlC-like cupin family protein
VRAPALHPVGRYEVFDLERIVDYAGTLYVGELAQRGTGGFDRVCFIAGVPEGASRGGHAHKDQAEYIVCVQGSVEVRLEARGDVALVALTRPGRTLYVPPGYWRDLFNFSSDAVLAVLAAHPFDENDYIRDRRAFSRWEAAAR